MADTPTIQADQIADAIVAVPGFTTTLTDGVPASTITVDGTSWQLVMPETGSITFSVPHSGLYSLVFSGEMAGQTSATSAGFKCVFDEGEASEQTVGDDASWYARFSNGVYRMAYMQGTVELSLGTHTLKVYAKELASEGQILIPSGQATPLSVRLSSVTGSGAGGVLAAEQVDTTSDYTDSTTNIVELTTLSLSATTVDEVVLVELGLHAYYPSGGTSHALYLYYRVNSGSWVEIQKVGLTAGNGVVPINVAFPLSVSAGNTTIDFAFQGSAAVERRIRPAEQGVAIRSSISRYRGGHVPVQNNGTTITSTPAALDFIGDNVSVTNVGGKAQIGFNGVAQGLDPEEFTMGATFSTTSASFVAVTDSSQGGTDFAVTVTVDEGERVLLTGKLALSATGGSGDMGANVGIGVNGADPSGPMSNTITAQTGENFPLSLSFLSDALGAGSHTFRIMARRSFGTPTLEIKGTATSTNVVSNLQATRIRGGYVKPENMPILEYSSASVVNVASAPGASGALRMVMNDGVRYTATSPLTVDLTASGLGGLDTGSEASDTWYYVYAVPSATAGVCDAVASVTDPDSGGPTGYDVWRYLGAVYNDSSNDLVKWYQIGAEFFRASELSLSIGSGSDGSPVQQLLASYVPITAASVSFDLYDNGNGSYAYVNVWADGDQSGTPRNYGETDYRGTEPVTIPTPTTPKAIYYQRNAAITACVFRFTGWSDGHLRGAIEARAQAPYTLSNLWRYFTPTDLPMGAAAPEAVWQFDGTGSELNDRTANGHDLTVEGGTKLHTASEGLVGLASNDTFRLYDGASPAGLRTTGAFTIAFLVAIEDTSTNNILFVTNSTDDTEAQNVLSQLNVKANRLIATDHESGLGVNENIEFDASPAFNRLQHIALTRSTNGLTYKIYVDGQLVDTKTASTAPTGGGSSVPYLMGGGGSSPANYYTGAMFCALFTKEEWSAAQVLEHYQWARRLG